MQGNQARGPSGETKQLGRWGSEQLEHGGRVLRGFASGTVTRQLCEWGFPLGPTKQVLLQGDSCVARQRNSLWLVERRKGLFTGVRWGPSLIPHWGSAGKSVFLGACCVRSYCLCHQDAGTSSEPLPPPVTSVVPETSGIHPRWSPCRKGQCLCPCEGPRAVSCLLGKRAPHMPPVLGEGRKTRVRQIR